MKCGDGCLTCTNATFCNECWSSNFNLTKGVCSCATKQVNANITECYYCKAGTYWNSTSKNCESCSFGCSNCTSAASCGICKPNWTKLSTGHCDCPTNNINPVTGDCIVCKTNEYFDGSSCKICPATCSFCAKYTGKCVVCPTLSTLANGTCVCQSGYAMNKAYRCELELSCAKGFFNNGIDNTCKSCISGCLSCEKYTGACLECTAPYSVLLNGTCGCKPDTYFNKTTNKCDDELSCSAGFYHVGVNNTCQPCGRNCTSCEKVTAKCITCAPNNTVNSTDPKSCSFSFCNYKVGPVGN